MLNAIATGGRYRARSYLHRELHSGQSEDEARAHARLGRKGWARDRRRRGQPPAATPLSQSVGPSSAGERVTGRSMQIGRTLAWDEKAGRVTGDDEANRLLLRPYRNPWVHPAPANV